MARSPADSATFRADAVTLPQYLAGVALFATTLIGACVTATTLVRRRFGDLAGAERALAWGVLATAALLAAYMVPGVLGILSRLTPAVAAVLLAVLARRLVPVAARAGGDRPAPGRAWATEPVLDRAVAVLAVLAAGAAALAYERHHATVPGESIDQLTFHLPVVARWIQTGSIWGVHDYVPFLGVGSYPHNGDVLSLASIAPWRYDAFQRFAQLPYFLIAGIAAYALGLRLGASRSASAVFGAVVVSIPMAIIPSVAFALPDATMLAMFGAGLVLLVRGDHLLAGIGLGLAFGTKWYGVSYVAAVLALWALALLAAGRPVRAVGRAAMPIVVGVAAAGGFWLVRNIVGSGSPFLGGWLPVGHHPADDLVRSEGRGAVDFTIAHYLFDLHVWREWLLPQLFAAFRLPGVLLVAALPAGAIALVRARRRGGVPRLPIVALLAAVVLVLVYTITPLSAQGLEGKPALTFANARYLVPAALPAAALAAWLCTRAGRWAVVVELAGLAAVIDGAHHGLRFGWGTFVAALAGLAVVWAFAHAARDAQRLTRAYAGAAVAIALVAGGQLLQTHFSRHRFVGLDPVLTFIQGAPRGTRVGLTGIWSSAAPTPTYPAFGPRLRKRVEYVGPFRGGRVERYTSCGAFVSGLRVTQSDLLVVGRGDPPVPHVMEEAWARAAGYVRVRGSRWFWLYRRAVTSAAGASAGARAAGSPCARRASSS